ncbi:EF-hand and coiled-coil domain-containing protein 1-like [Protopterus annectens]|uniref:EF-hand and coiled-coil domain-containing protein 1-like n=1 Tax=Protopterus annectens TaxID=7888 RepID=UPI001CFAB7DA|nr:EF-hand and coiled-coil domain-containing protein 1-like [Protopterus annectens]
MIPLLELPSDTKKVSIPLIHFTPRNFTAAGSQWLYSVLSYHFSRDPGVQNDMVVSVTGIDQYLHEIFHHLTFGGELLPWNDFILFCSTLRLLEEETEVLHLLTAAPSALTFQEFNSRLYGYFRLQSAGRVQTLPASQVVEREIHLRWSPVRRKKYVSFNLSPNGKKGSTFSKMNHRGFGSILKQRNLHDCKGEVTSCQGETEAEDTLSRRQLDNARLQDLVEELRSALQSSDARCLALEVALLKVHPTDHPYDCSSSLKVDMREIQDGNCSNPESTASKTARQEFQDLTCSIDKQAEEAKNITQHNDSNLHDSNEEVVRLTKKVLLLTKENYKIKKKMQEVRNALTCGLEKVRMLQSQADQLPELEKKVSELQEELRHSRPRCCPGWQVNYQTCNHSNWLSSSNTATSVLQSQMNSVEKELQLKKEEAKIMKNKLQTVEKEQLHLSLIEQRLMEVLKLLQQLRPPNISRRYLGKIIMDSLESCSITDQGSSQVLEVLGCLHEQLLSYDLQSASEQIPACINNSLIISC